MTRTPDHGRPGPHTSEGMRDLWNSAERLNRDFPGPGEWVPVRSIEVRRELTPRDGEPDRETCEKYAEAFDALPPIQVQRDTFVLIDGWHRLRSTRYAVRDHIRIIETDVSDDELEDAALVANVRHGRPLTAFERRNALEGLIRRHGPESVDPWHDERIASAVSVGVHHVRRITREMQAQRDKKASKLVDMRSTTAVPDLNNESNVTGSISLSTERRAGLDEAIRRHGPDSADPWHDERIAKETSYTRSAVSARIREMRDQSPPSPFAPGIAPPTKPRPQQPAQPRGYDRGDDDDNLAAQIAALTATLRRRDPSGVVEEIGESQLVQFEREMRQSAEWFGQCADAAYARIDELKGEAADD